jgi:hypothetical protein
MMVSATGLSLRAAPIFSRSVPRFRFKISLLSVFIVLRFPLPRLPHPLSDVNLRF